MRKTLPAASADVVGKLTAFVLDRFPFALPIVQPIAARAADPAAFLAALDVALVELDGTGIPDPTPGVAATDRLDRAREELRAACVGFFERVAIAASLTAAERREILRGMILTRATDNRLKTFFTFGEVRYGGRAVSGKGLSLARPGGDLRGGPSA